MRQLLTDFYREVAQTSDLTPLFANRHLERDPQNGYVSATACQRCHQQEYLQWSATRHAFAYETLLKKERYFDSGCVSCHTTGLGYSTGFQIGDQDSTLKGVQCETCHGPGKQHVGNPKKTNIRRGADTIALSWNATTRNILPDSQTSWHSIPRISIIAASR